MNPNKGLSLGFEFLDIEIIDHKKEPKLSNGKWNCDECSLFFLSQDKLAEHKNKHSAAAGEAFKCRYCNKVLSIKEESKESFANRKCSTCEYKCSKCPLRFQRHSSFVNHEKSHLLLKKKKSISLKKKQSRPETKKIINISRKRKTGKIATEKQKIIKRKGNSDEHITETISPKKRKTLPGMPQNEKSESIDTNNKSQTNDKKIKPCITTNSKTSEENTNQTNDNKTKQCVTTNIKTSEDKSVGEKQNNKTNAPTDSVNNSSHDSIVNYKPFSCHICGDNFASGDSLIAHIQTHGENVSKGFKCKHCGDEFDDIYKMQYHLAICPLAEDETINVKNIPPKFHITPTNGLPRKKGRPKKIKQDNSDKDSDNDQTPSFSRRKSVKTRKKVDKTSESATETTNILCNSSSKYSTRLRRSKADKTEENCYSLTNEFVDINSHYMKNHSDIMEDDPLEVKENINDPFNDSFETVEDDKAKVHSCPFPRCGIKFSREKALLCHMRNHNDDFEDSYKCHKCDIPFDDIQSLRSHLNECKDVKEENEESVSEPEYTDNYISTDKSFQKKRGALSCNICGRTYLSQEQMKRCLHNTFDNSEKTSSCRLCGEICDNEETLKKHFRSVHSKHLPFQCSICHTEFDTKKAESEHFSTHLDGDNFQCIVCSLNLPTYKDLYFHYKQDHVTKQQSICKICNKIFPNEFLLQKHRCKTEEKQCIFCHKFFSSAASLTIHIKRHTNKKIYKCRICYRAFFDTGDLMKHMLFHATLVGDERPYKCCICFVSYTHKKLLASHITNSHLGKTLSEVKCPICGETSKNDKMMTSHLMRHSMRVSKNNMTKLETEWLKQTGSNPSESPALPKRGRPRKLSSSVCTMSDTSQNSRYDPIEYSTRKMHSKINSDNSELENKAEMKCNSEDTGTFDDYLTNGDLWTMTKQQVKSKVGIIKHRKRGTNLKMNSSDVDLSDSSDGRSVKSDLEQFGIRKLHNNVEKSTNDQRNDASSSNLKYNTRGANLKIKSGIAESIGGKSKKEDVSDISNKPKLPIKYNLVQSRINLKTTDQSKNSNKLTLKANIELIESLHQNNIASKQRPMSFIKVTSSRNKNKLKPKQIIRNKNMISQNSKKTMFAKTPSYFAKQHLVGKKRMSEDLQNGKSDSLHSIGDIKIEDEELEMSPIFDKQMYLNSIKTRINENEHVSNHIKIEDESEILMPYDKNMTWPTIKKEETESFIKEKKYYEPSLGLTEYSCTTCLLSFSSQDELLVHNTQHIL